VPVKEISERVPNKNFREFGAGQSLFSRKIQQLVSSSVDEIYVSTNSRNLLSSQSISATLLPRDERYCNNEAPWSEVITAVLADIPEPDDVTLVWAHTTVPFFSRFDEAVREYELRRGLGSSDSLLSTSVVSEFLLSPSGLPVNYQWGKWHSYSQNLPRYRAVTGGVFVLSLGLARELGYLVGRAPFFFDSGGDEALDIDSLDEFRYAHWLQTGGLSAGSD